MIDLISGSINNESKILYRRNIMDMVATFTPFLEFDDDPYLVISEGKLFWMLDAYNRWCHYELCLHGDPAMPQWVDVYGTLAMNHSGTYQVGQGNYPVTVTAGGSPVSGATVTMYSVSFPFIAPPPLAF